MNTYLSNKLYFFSFWLIVLVVFLHSLNVDISKCDDFICDFQYFIAHKVTQVAVPLFFAITGYLYFLKMDSAFSKMQFFIDNNKKRLKTIVIPFFIWCLFWFTFLFLLQQLPFLTALFSKPLHKMSFSDQLSSLFIAPVNYPFWFLRDLILLLAISPIIYISIRYLNFFALFLYFILSVFYNTILTINGADVFLWLPIFYFSLGAFFSIYKFDLRIHWSKLTIVILLAVWITLNVMSIYFESNFINKTLLKSLNLFKDLLGCVAFWSLYDLLNLKKQWNNFTFYKYSFFIFAFHGIPTLLFVKLLKQIFINKYVLFLAFCFTPLLILLLSILLASTINRLSPKFYSLICGSR